ncbi:MULTISPECIES: hypothetical protein [unclassified Clostridioides]|uniref:hypothetical protein n=1 Tax=unclassified Clostridioides TaxID=2635829 RepID=UPI001D1203D1|nr:hypothetical protein [Clostridioides sp. ES-S-0001-02]MCC0638984.1 hypothetical protein [Clostridioides sp. ES-S-0049-03]MCC0657289.1 hypothetical protein [Clostridioides sp. ES-S-0123-01]MCC0672694.1 hypothetical protein [Clostridioides sp. ES-S-0145-01]MCC0675374.1 hypothetical protein [Clostridioides sp. ES-W-0018-02]MCC0679990.1 hypothetical protein [Clostridioides sp. ES-S-0005-03]MCC0701964.1 hypothetical protein [Clostridioides sp. ES-S-0049-02]MCC0709817.1 hypothetical protein [Cl
MNKLLKPITILLYIVYVLCAIFFATNRAFGNVGLVAISLIGTFILSILNRQNKRLLSNELYIVLVLFIMFASLLGTCFNFYDINYYDDFLHLWSGIISCIVAFSTIKYFYIQKDISKMSKIFLVIFVFMFSMGVASLWEIGEFLMDTFIGTTTQAGGLEDTMIDMVDALIGTIITIPFIIKKSNA